LAEAKANGQDGVQKNDGGSSESSDLMRFFLDDYRSEKPKTFVNKEQLYSDAETIFIGGA
jgi:hypothetical protein